MIRSFCLTALLALTGLYVQAQTFTVDTLLNNGNKANRINLVILADGYTSSQQTQFVSDATSMINQFFATPPLSYYKSFFNVYAVRVVSLQSGAKHPGTASDCYTANPAVPASSATSYFGATFDYGGTHRLLYCTNTAAISQVLSNNTPWFDKALILVNSPYYGGSGGNYSIGSVHPSSAEIMIHEFGHSFAGLADEYGGSYCSGAEKPNVTQQTNPSLIKWKNWIDAGTAIPTPANTNCGQEGLYNGANYCTNGWYRPSCDCKMRTLGQPLCAVCKQEFVVKIHQYINLIDVYTPTSTSMTLNSGSQTFSASVLQPTTNTIKRIWKLNGNTVATNVNSYTVNATSLLTGSNTLTLSATDTTSLSKTTLPTSTVTWTITKSTSGTVATLAAFSPVCTNSSTFTLFGGLPLGGVYSGTGVSGGMFNPAAAGAGTHTITYTVLGVSASQNIVVNAAPVIGGSSSATFCQGGSVTLTASGAQTYSWSPSTGLNTTIGSSVSASPSSNTTYVVTATQNGCTSTKSIPVSVSTPPTLSSSSNTSVCPGTSTTLTIAGANSYVWTPASTLNTNTGSSVLASPAASTTYTVTGTGSNGCTASKTIAVAVNSQASINISGITSICNGSSASLVASGAQSYTWSPSTGLNTTSGASVTATPAVTTTYTVNGTLNGCSGTQTVVVSVGSLGNVTTTANTFICTGSNTTLSANGATSYTWAPSTGLNATTGSTVVASPASSITYTVTATSGSCSTTKTIGVTVNSAPTLTGSSSATLCSGNSTGLSVSGANTYTWSPSTGLSATTGSSVTASPASSVTYTVTGYGAGCSSTKLVAVTVNPAFTMSVSSPSVTVCNGTSATLSASGAITYVWSPSIGLSATTGSIVSALPSYNLTYTVVGTKNGCTQTKTVAVSVNSISVNVTSGSSGICSGTSTSLSASGGTTYAWSPSTGLSATSGSSVTASPTSTTTYTVTATSNGCSGTSTKVIGVTPSFTLIGSSSTSICPGNAAALSASGATSYSWTPGTGLNATAGSNVTAAPTATITYTVTGTTGYCTKTKNIVVTVKPKPTLSATTTPASCSGTPTGTVDLIVSGVTTTVYYSWSNGATTQDLNGVVAGNYSVTATPVGGCSNTKLASVAGGSCGVPSQYFTSNIGTANATLKWRKVACAVKYKVRYKTSAGSTWSYSSALTDTTLNLSGLAQSTAYQFQVQTYCNTALTDSSGYSSTQSFSTIGGCTAPTGLSTSNMTFESAKLNWGAVSGAWGYKVRIRRSNNAGSWMEFTVQSPTLSYNVMGLLSSTSYKWQVMTLCNASGTSASAYSSLVYFTTFSGREGEEEPVLPIISEDETMLVNVFPNPTMGQLTVSVEQSLDTEATLELYNALGQLLRREDVTLLPGTTSIPWNIGELPAGTYVLNLRQSDNVTSKKVVKQ